MTTSERADRVGLSRREWWGLAGWGALCFGVAALGAVASVSAADFYGELDQPSWAPPAGVFGPVWSLLYALMAVAAWRVWRAPASGPRRLGIALFMVQLAVNALWSWLFFAWHMGGAALVDVTLLAGLIMATAAVFWRVSRLAAALMLPYLAWVGFATLLNAAVWQLNPDRLGAALL